MPTYTVNTLGQADFDLADALDDPGCTRSCLTRPGRDPRVGMETSTSRPDAGLHPSPNPRQAQEVRTWKGGGPDVEAGDGEARMERPGCREPSVEARIYGPGCSVLARVVSPVVSVVVVALVGAAITYF
ncbi:PREDICTED: glycoprotein Xg-like [Dipodomys ordii]|uniref:Glycoprotein Xg-like n=1 Tax=Dipodomys ordii TaxID=10020 RepID=A0A1S3GW22_DIPOR|nr:PREDICTED: glycoprotein Xg-like [Dipodomys ordii]